MSQSTQHPQLADNIAGTLEVHEPQVIDALAVYPVTGPDPKLEYLSFAQAQAAGVVIKELDAGASVRQLTVHNPTDRHVLLFEGEEVLGAQQNRTFDQTILVGAGETLTVPVSCVEAGRWDGARHGEGFVPSSRTAYPDLRRQKRMRAQMSAEAGGPAAPDQGEVWSNVADKAIRLETMSPTGAMNDIYEGCREQIERMSAAIETRPNQIGAVVAIGGEFVTFDHVSRANVFASMHSALVQGYVLDAIEADPADAPSVEAANGFALLALDCEPQPIEPSIGMGRGVSVSGNGVSGAGVVHDGELIQLSAFPATHTGDEARQSGRVRRPSRRRS